MPLRVARSRDGTPLPDTWDVVVTLPRGADGRRRRRQVRIRGTRAAAERALHRLERDAERGEVVAGRLSVGALFDRYLAEHVAVHLAPNTQTSYRVALTVRALVLRTLPLAALARHHLSAHEARLRESGVSPVSVVRYLHPVKAALQWAESVELLPPARNPARQWRIADARPAERPTFTRAQAAAFLAALDGSPWRVHLLVLAFTGLRLSELRGLRLVDCDLAAGTYDVHQQWQRVMQPVAQGGQPDGRTRWTAVDVRRPVPKSQQGRRGGGFPPPVTQALRQWVAQLHSIDRARTGRQWRTPEGGALLLPDPTTGAPFDGDALRHAYYRLLRQAGLPKLRIHDVRHSFVTLSLEAGVPEHVVPQLAGHTRRVDELVYRHRTRQAGVDAAALLWDYVSGTSNETGESSTPPRP